MNQRAVRIGAVRAVEAVKSGKSATRSECEDGAKIAYATVGRGPVQVPIRSLNQRCSRILAIRASRLRAKAVERGSVPLTVILKIVPLP